MDDLKNILNAEYENIIDNHWNFLNNTYKSNIKKQYQRKKLVIIIIFKILRKRFMNY